LKKGEETSAILEKGELEKVKARKGIKRF